MARLRIMFVLHPPLPEGAMFHTLVASSFTRI